MSLYVLGPAIESVVEPSPVPHPITVGRIGVNFHPEKPTEVGGKVNVQLTAPRTANDVRPIAVHAIYTTPPSRVPPVGQRTAEWFLANGNAKAQVAVPKPPVPVGDIQIAVPGVVPGTHHVQTVLEYEG